MAALLRCWKLRHLFDCRLGVDNPFRKQAADVVALVLDYGLRLVLEGNRRPRELGRLRCAYLVQYQAPGRKQPGERGGRPKIMSEAPYGRSTGEPPEN